MIPENYVCIKQAPTFTHMAGMKIIDGENTHRPNYGVVVDVPQNLFFSPYKGKQAARSSVLDQKRQRLRKQSLEVSTTMELKKGDTVMFKYIYGIDDTEKFNELLFIPYDDIYCKMEPELETLNDYCLIIPDESFVDELGGHFQKYRKGSGTVHRACKGIIHYADYPIIAGSPKKGDYVYFKWTSAPKMEANIHQMLNQEGEFSLLKIRAKDIRFKKH